MLQDNWVSMAVPSDGSYGITEGIVYSFPVKIDPATKEWHVVKDLSIDEWSREKMTLTLKELTEERDEAVAACQ